jgi:hypothetical protein
MRHGMKLLEIARNPNNNGINLCNPVALGDRYCTSQWIMYVKMHMYLYSVQHGK